MDCDIENKDMLSFIAFYNRLSCKENIIFMYFSAGLLHYAIESCALVPKSKNLVLITTCLSEAEEVIISEKIGRPYLNFSTYYHDGDIWNLIVLVVRHNFGWLDVDCFIFNEKIFDEMLNFDKGVGINTLWAKSYECYGLERLFSNTYFQFLRYDALKQVLMKYGNINMLPIVFDNLREDIPYERYYFMSEEQLNKLFSLYPVLKNDEKGLDTTHYYQLLMFAEGYKINRVRELSQMKQYYSDEALHLGGCHMIHRTKLDKSLKRIYYRFNMRYSFCLLLKYLEILPDEYKKLYNSFENNMKDNKLSCERCDLERQILEYSERNGLKEVVRAHLLTGEWL